MSETINTPSGAAQAREPPWARAGAGAGLRVATPIPEPPSCPSAFAQHLAAFALIGGISQRRSSPGCHGAARSSSTLSEGGAAGLPRGGARGWGLAGSRAWGGILFAKGPQLFSSPRPCGLTLPPLAE